MYKLNGIVYKNPSRQTLLYVEDKSIETFKIEKGTNFIKAGAFDDCIYLKNIILSNDKEIILQENAFNCPNIENIFLGNVLSVSNLERFINLKNLKTITITTKARSYYDILKFLEKYKTPNIEEIIIQKNNPNIKTVFSENGVIYLKDHFGSFISYYPQGKKDTAFEIPTFVNRTDLKVFCKNPYINTVIAKSSIDFTENTFMDCPNLETLVLKDANNLKEKLWEKCPIKNIYADVDKDISINSFAVHPLEEYEIKTATSFKKINEFYKKKNHR